MAVVEATPQVEPDHAPIWLPRHDQIALDQSVARPPDRVDGYGWPSRLATTIFGSRRKTAVRAGAVVALVCFFAVLPSLAGGGWGGLIKVAIYQSWTLAIVLAVTWRVRSVSIPTVAAFWLFGMFTTVLLVDLVAGPVSDLTGTGDRRAVWVLPVVEELFKALPLIAAVVVGRKLWRHPGVADLMVLGFAVGGGFAFHEDALWERTTASGLEANFGFLIPSMFQPEGGFSVGHAVWTALIGCAIGLLVLHRRAPLPFAAAVFTILFVVADHMAVNDQEGTLSWVSNITLGSHLLTLMAIGGLVAAVMLDSRRLSDTAIRDHLFPTPRRFFIWKSNDDPDMFATMLTGRYRRRRNGVHTTVNSVETHWPPLSDSEDPPIAELARLARAAGVAAGPGSSPVAWAPEPDEADDHRFVGLDGWTAYVVSDDVPETSVPRARPEARAVEVDEQPENFWQTAGFAAAGVAVVSAFLVLVFGDGSAPGVDFGLAASLADAPNSPPLIRTTIGALGAGVAVFGLDRPGFGGGTEVGPPDDSRAPKSNDWEA